MANENRDRDSKKESPGRSQQSPRERGSHGEGRSSSGSGPSGQPDAGGGMSREEIRKKRSGGLGSQGENQESEE